MQTRVGRTPSYAQVFLEKGTRAQKAVKYVTGAILEGDLRYRGRYLQRQRSCCIGGKRGYRNLRREKGTTKSFSDEEYFAFEFPKWMSKK